MRLRPIVRTIAVALLPVLPLSSVQSPPKNSQHREALLHEAVTGISLRFVPPSRPFAANEDFQIQAILKNESAQTVFVCRQLSPGFGSDEPCDWEFSIRDAKGRALPGVGWAADRVLTSRDDFSTALIKHWIALAPGYSYSAPVNVSIAFWKTPRPGRYEIIGAITSYGLDGQSIYNDLASYPDEIGKLPYPGWKGTIKSNKIWITIDLPRSKAL
jgi:hypothetical protein